MSKGRATREEDEERRCVREQRHTDWGQCRTIEQSASLLGGEKQVGKDTGVSGGGGGARKLAAGEKQRRLSTVPVRCGGVSLGRRVGQHSVPRKRGKGVCVCGLSRGFLYFL